MAEKLFSDFPSISTKEWENKINTDLKGADYERKLVWRTSEGFKVPPYYREEDTENLPAIGLLPGEFPFLRSVKLKSNQWLIRQDILVENIDKANEIALNALMKGANSLAFVFGKPVINSQSDFSRLLRGIRLDALELNFEGIYAADYLSFLYNEAKAQNIAVELLHGSVNYNPMSYLLQTGGCVERSPEVALEKLSKMLEFAAQYLPTIQIISIDGALLHNSGATITQELGFSLAQANDYISRLVDNGLSKGMVARTLRFKFSVGSNYFMEIAKFRAARWLWSKILEAWRVNDYQNLPPFIHAETSKWNMTIYDSYVNMLRNTTEAMSAVIAGVDSLSVLPFDSPYAMPNDFSERIARNVQNVLKEEAYLDKIIDPAAGSYYIENLTQQIAEKAWEYFLKIEDESGFLDAIQEGFIQQTINVSAQERDMALAQRKEILLGTNQYPNLNNKYPEKIEEERFYSPVFEVSEQLVYPLKPYRGAITFEELRRKTDKMPERPKVFLFTYGNVNIRKLRAGFAFNFFGCAGYEIIDNNGFDTISTGLLEIDKQKPKIVVACSSDNEYSEFVEQLNERLDNRIIFVIAGNPKNRAEYEKIGIKHFIHSKTNILESLQKFMNLID